MEMWVCICCRNGGYVSVAEIGVCLAEMGGMYQLQKWGVYISCSNGDMCCGNVGYVLWKWGVCSSCRNGGYVLQKWGDVSVAEMGDTTTRSRNVSIEVM